MATRYYVLVSQELLDITPPPMWEEAGLQLIEQGGFTQPGVRWCLFEDDNAPEYLNGKKVDLTLKHEQDGSTRVIDRQVIT